MARRPAPLLRHATSSVTAWAAASSPVASPVPRSAAVHAPPPSKIQDPGRGPDTARGSVRLSPDIPSATRGSRARGRGERHGRSAPDRDRVRTVRSVGGRCALDPEVLFGTMPEECRECASGEEVAATGQASVKPASLAARMSGVRPILCSARSPNGQLLLAVHGEVEAVGTGSHLFILWRTDGEGVNQSGTGRCEVHRVQDEGPARDAPSHTCAGSATAACADRSRTVREVRPERHHRS